jgi:hypothetical protein
MIFDSARLVSTVILFKSLARRRYRRPSKPDFRRFCPCKSVMLPSCECDDSTGVTHPAIPLFLARMGAHPLVTSWSDELH